MNQSQINSQIHNFAPGQDEPSVQTVQTSAKEGEWMSIAKASEATGLHEKTLRRHIKKKLLRAKRTGSSTNSPLLVYITSESLKAVYAETSVVEDEMDDLDELDLEESGPGQAAAEPGTKGASAAEIESIIKAITQQFADKLDQQMQLIYDLRNEVVEKERQLLLIPDMQRQVEERERAEKLVLKEKLDQAESELAQLKLEKEQLHAKKKSWLQWFLGTGG